MENNYNIGGQIWVQKNGGNFMGPGRINLLEKLIENPRLTLACKEANMDYEVALKNLESINKIAQEPLTTISDNETYEVTQFGKKIIKIYKKLKEEHDIQLQELNKRFLDEIEEYLDSK
ncbi:hypothetical protein [Malaciobacter mytili]|uniref:Transcriptional regulator, ModE family n=1 Tax=Malaciobacter mytili LMG 24559 TaxID=1032238 RepID=A0AAX2AKF6_9BACT|nr:hypothetical protein [Malaciobacter mytili]AXH14839.1 putative transcriptional regulator, ModE family [Malaciobacter mytili LMG 24559]RXI48062.1 hypothetical protein CRU99_02035 [Malaciobacter mytili]RXK16791.1 hypothetical protein CP985_01140 [Malaciobacter mytili LMG 24559]